MRKPKRSTPARALDFLIWGLVVGLLIFRFAPQARAAMGWGGIDRQAPAFQVVTLDGQAVSRDGLRGKVVLVNFWATWCPPCRMEMPAFQRLYEEKRGEGFVVVGLAADERNSGEVRRFLERRGITYPVAFANGGLTQAFGGVRGLPTSFLIDRKGMIRHTVTGYFAEPALRLAVDRLLAEAAPGPKK